MKNKRIDSWLYETNFELPFIRLCFTFNKCLNIVLNTDGVLCPFLQNLKTYKLRFQKSHNTFRSLHIFLAFPKKDQTNDRSSLSLVFVGWTLVFSLKVENSFVLVRFKLTTSAVQHRFSLNYHLNNNKKKSIFQILCMFWPVRPLQLLLKTNNNFKIKLSKHFQSARNKKS